MITNAKSNYFRTIRTLVLFILGLFILGLYGCGGTVNTSPNVEKNAGNTPLCTADQIEEWNFINTHMQGVAGRDPVGEHIGFFDEFQDRQWPASNNHWHPNFASKLTLCGTLDHFNFTATWGNEDDWNNYIIPSSEERFSNLFNIPLAILGPDEFHKCANSQTPNCMEGEITPTQEFFDNPWFPKAEGESALEGRYICTYGPWVGDGRHNLRPEIHPSELYWYHSPPDEFGRGVVTTLMLLHDDSERFNRVSDFEVPDPPPAEWRPWAAAPRTGEFNMAFEVRIGAVVGSVQPVNFDIYEADAPYGQRPGTSDSPDGFVVTSSNPTLSQDADDGTEHALRYNNQVAIQVHELQPRDDDIGVQFRDVCRVEEGTTVQKTRLQGYVTLTSMVGKNDNGGEGFHVLNVQTYEGANPGPPRALDTTQASFIAKILPQTVHSVNIGGKIEILADVQVSLNGRPNVTETDMNIVKVETLVGDQRQELIITSLERQKDANITRGILKDVSVSTGAQLELTTESGTVFHFSAPLFTVAPTMRTETPLQSSNDAATWSSMLAIADGDLQASIAPPDQFQKVSQWEFEVTPWYAPLRDEEVSLEDDSPVVEELNETLMRGDTRRLREFFGSDKPFSTEWSYSAKNLITGQGVPVNTTGNAAANEIQVEIEEDGSTNQKMKITFPESPDDALFELTITVKMTDTLGKTGELQHMIWSHALFDQDKNKLVEYIIPTVAVLAGAPPDDFLAAGQRDLRAEQRKLLPPDSKNLIAGMIRSLAIQAADDQFISVSEFTDLIRGAKLFVSR